MTADDSKNRLEHAVRAMSDVPVYNCHVYLSPPDERGMVRVRAASLAELFAEGPNEREALRNVVRRFKEMVGGLMSRAEPIPWLAEPSPPQPGETQCFVPVHF